MSKYLVQSVHSSPFSISNRSIGIAIGVPAKAPVVVELNEQQLSYVKLHHSSNIKIVKIDEAGTVKKEEPKVKPKEVAKPIEEKVVEEVAEESKPIKKATPKREEIKEEI